MRRSPQKTPYQQVNPTEISWPDSRTNKGRNRTFPGRKALWIKAIPSQSQ